MMNILHGSEPFQIKMRPKSIIFMKGAQQVLSEIIKRLSNKCAFFELCSSLKFGKSHVSKRFFNQI